MNHPSDASGVLKTAAATRSSIAEEIAATADGAKELARAAGRLADQHVHDRPWQTALIAGSVGLLVGLLLRSRF